MKKAEKKLRNARFTIPKNHVMGLYRFRRLFSKYKSHMFFGRSEPLIKMNRFLIFLPSTLGVRNVYELPQDTYGSQVIPI